jgi:hypothetical protein
VWSARIRSRSDSLCHIADSVVVLVAGAPPWLRAFGVDVADAGTSAKLGVQPVPLTTCHTASRLATAYHACLQAFLFKANVSYELLLWSRIKGYVRSFRPASSKLNASFGLKLFALSKSSFIAGYLDISLPPCA